MITLNGKIYYKYEMHCHTKDGSCCSKVTANELLSYYKNLDYDGVFVTNHFIGSTPIPSNVSWQEHIERTYNSYLIAKKVGDDIGLDVFFAFEHTNKGTDFLWYKDDLYGYMKSVQDFRFTNMKDNLLKFREDGGFVTQAHPFSEATYIDHIRLYPFQIDAVEVYNGKQPKRANEMAKIFCESYGLLQMTGSDRHDLVLGDDCSVLVEKKCKTVSEFITLIKNNEYILYSRDKGIIKG